MVESSLSEISSETIRSAVQETIVKYLQTDKVEISVGAASKTGDNFIGIVYRVSFSKLEQNGKSENVSKKMIVKVAPNNPARRERFFSRPCFLREIYLYDEVLPFFRKFQESKGIIPEENGFYEYPKCYKTIDSDLSECLMLEDLKAKNFLMIDRHTEAITPDHVRLVMQALGKFHAISYALKDQQPEKFKALTSNIDEIFVRRSDKQMNDYINFLTKGVIDSVSDGKHEDLVEKLNKLYRREQIDIAADCVNGALEPKAVLCHGDCWSNNTMFKYGEKNEVVEACLIDWQISRYASPVCDILYYVFCCTEKDMRDKHYDSWLKVYHESLTNLLNKLGSDAEKIFPYTALLDQLHAHGVFGLVMASMLLPMLTAEEGNTPDLDELSEDLNNGKELDPNVFMSEKSRESCNRRLREVVIDMARLEYI